MTTHDGHPAPQPSVPRLYDEVLCDLLTQCFVMPS